jgi:4-hydroxy-tetrahydrodipicolinate synthase
MPVDPKLNWKLPGNVVPPITPFTSGGEVDYATLAREIDYVIASSRPAAICVAGVEAQEYQYLSDDQRRLLIRETIAMIGGRVPALVGISHASYRTSIALAEYAKDLGASAVQLLLPNRPSGGPATTAEIVAYFELISSETPLPVVAYHNQGPGADMSVAGLLEVLALDNVVALKESSRNQRFLAVLLHDATTRKLAHIFTTLEVLLGTLILGASGGTMPPPGSALSALLVEAFHAGDLPRAIRVQQLLSVMPAQWVSHGLVSVSKISLRAIGLDCGLSYPPFGTVPPKHVAEIEAFWQSALAEFPELQPNVATAAGA